MYRIKTDRDVSGHSWGLDFTHGEATTEREDLARRLRSLGYRVEEIASPSPAGVAALDDEDDLFCPVCNKALGSKSALTRHMRKEHPEG